MAKHIPDIEILGPEDAAEKEARVRDALLADGEAGAAARPLHRGGGRRPTTPCSTARRRSPRG